MEQRHIDRIRQRAIDAAESEAPPKSSWPRTLGIAGGALAVGLLIWFFVSRAMPSGDGETASADDESVEVEEPDRDYTLVNVEAEVAKFLSAESIEEMLKLVDHPEETEPRMRKFFAEEGGKKLPLGGRIRQIFSEVEWEDRRVYPVMIDGMFPNWSVLSVVLDGEANPKILWEESVGWMDPTWEAVLESRPEEKTLVRIFGKLDDYYNYDFVDEKKWVCLRLAGSDLKSPCYGYIKRKDIESTVMQNLLARSPLILELKFLPGGQPNQAEITRLIERGWMGE